jgi:phage tail tape-measure protein
MKSKKKAKGDTRKGSSDKRRIAHEAEGGASGALAGAVVGAAAGPPGIVAGAILGGVAGALAGAVLDQESSASEQRTRELDADIGVSGGDLGAPNLKHPPPTSGAYSEASSGVAPAEEAPAEGPIQTPNP